MTTNPYEPPDNQWLPPARVAEVLLWDSNRDTRPYYEGGRRLRVQREGDRRGRGCHG